MIGSSMPLVRIGLIVSEICSRTDNHAQTNTQIAFDVDLALRWAGRTTVRKHSECAKLEPALERSSCFVSNTVELELSEKWAFLPVAILTYAVNYRPC